jgi:hypothetical protein
MMMNEFPAVRGTIRSAVISYMISALTTRVAAKSAAVAGSSLVAALMSLPPNQAVKSMTNTFISFMWTPAHVQVVKVAPHRRVVRDVRITSKPVTQEMANRLYLHTFEKDYICAFSGKVTCGGATCPAAEVKIHVNSKQNPNIIRTVPIQSDGSYEVNIPLREELNEYVDWWVTADSPESAAKQVQGRQILTDNPKVEIDTPLPLL